MYHIFQFKKNNWVLKIPFTQCSVESVFFSGLLLGLWVIAWYKTPLIVCNFCVLRSSKRRKNNPWGILLLFFFPHRRNQCTNQQVAAASPPHKWKTPLKKAPAAERVSLDERAQWLLLHTCVVFCSMNFVWNVYRKVKLSVVNRINIQSWTLEPAE